MLDGLFGMFIGSGAREGSEVCEVVSWKVHGFHEGMAQDKLQQRVSLHSIEVVYGDWWDAEQSADWANGV